MDALMHAARLAFLGGADPDEGVRRIVLESWRRSRKVGARFHGEPPFVGHAAADSELVGAAESAFAAVLESDTEPAHELPVSIMLIDEYAIIRLRRDGALELGTLLDRLGLTPGASIAEADIGTTAADLAMRTGHAITLQGPEHLHHGMCGLDEAAAPTERGTIAVFSLEGEGPAFITAIASVLAGTVREAVAQGPRRHGHALADAFAAANRSSPGAWVLVSDGESVTTNGAARSLTEADLRCLEDCLVTALALGDFAEQHLDLPSGLCVCTQIVPIEGDGYTIGAVLTGMPTATGAAQPADQEREAARRQGAHVAPLSRRDFADGFRASDIQREFRQKAMRELLSPILRARQEVAVATQQRRGYLLTGESGVGKRALAIEQFRAAHPTGAIVEIAGDGPVEGPFPSGCDEAPTLLLVRGIEHLNPAETRRLDAHLARYGDAILAVGTLEASSVDARRPYGLLLRHFHSTIRVPPLRSRIEDLGGLALGILRRIDSARSLRLPLQTVRVMEGYSWPGNLSELEDVLRFAAARKQVGDIQPSDLPPVCFQGRSRKLSMLEVAQCDAIVQALYESRGNRFRAAEMLGIARSSLYRKIDAFGISYVS